MRDSRKTDPLLAIAVIGSLKTELNVNFFGGISSPSSLLLLLVPGVGEIFICIQADIDSHKPALNDVLLGREQ